LGIFEIYTINVDGSNPTNLTTNTADDENPSWSSDGEHFIFATTRDGNQEIYYANANGSNPTRLTD
jgi:TolB protein